MTNPYKVLGVNEGATNEEIRAAYLSLVKKYHPDKYTDPDMKQLANEKLKEINEAYDQLTKNPGKTASSGYSGAAYGAGGHGGLFLDGAGIDIADRRDQGLKIGLNVCRTYAA